MDFIEINAASRIPKYKQIIDSIKAGIREQKLLMGDKILSINGFSEKYDISRDTVEKAYTYLRSQNIIASVKGKGYYVAKTDLMVRLNVLFVVNKLSTHKMRIYNALVEALGRANAKVDIEIYHCEPAVFKYILNKRKGQYDYFVIIPHFKDDNLGYMGCTEDIMEVLREIPADKLIILDQDVQNISDQVGKIYQDFTQDIYNALKDSMEQLRKYRKIILVYPSRSVYPYPKEIVRGFKMFCDQTELDHEVLDQIYDSMELQLKDLYIIIQEEDLVNLVKQSRDRHLKLGEDIGIISYNDTPLKELLGITVITTDFDKMGITAAEMILSKRRYSVKNDFNRINRHSA